MGKAEHIHPTPGTGKTQTKQLKAGRSVFGVNRVDVIVNIRSVNSEDRYSDGWLTAGVSCKPYLIAHLR